MIGSSNTLGLESAYSKTWAAQTSEHYIAIRLLGTIVPIEVRPPEEPFGFSRERWLSGEADVVAGRYAPLSPVLNAIRARHRGHGG